MKKIFAAIVAMSMVTSFVLSVSAAENENTAMSSPVVMRALRERPNSRVYDLGTERKENGMYRTRYFVVEDTPMTRSTKRAHGTAVDEWYRDIWHNEHAATVTLDGYFEYDGSEAKALQDEVNFSYSTYYSNMSINEGDTTCSKSSKKARIDTKYTAQFSTIPDSETISITCTPDGEIDEISQDELI